MKRPAHYELRILSRCEHLCLSIRGPSAHTLSPSLHCTSSTRPIVCVHVQQFSIVRRHKVRSPNVCRSFFGRKIQLRLHVKTFAHYVWCLFPGAPNSSLKCQSITHPCLRACFYARVKTYHEADRKERNPCQSIFSGCPCACVYVCVRAYCPARISHVCNKI